MTSNQKTLLVTGGGRGIGAAIALAAGNAGYHIIVNYNRSNTKAEEVVEQVRAAGGSAMALQADVSRQDDVQRMFQKIDSEVGRIDVLVNNAGVLSNFLVEEANQELIDDTFHANVYSTFYCSREAIFRMSTKHGGSGGVIINMSSVASRLGGLAGGAAYAASKGAIDSFTLALSKEVGTSGIRVVSIRPGLIETEIHAIHGGLENVRNLAKTAVPLGRSGDSSEVANVVLWAASDDASYVHGTCIDVAGGR